MALGVLQEALVLGRIFAEVAFNQQQATIDCLAKDLEPEASGARRAKCGLFGRGRS